MSGIKLSDAWLFLVPPLVFVPQKKRNVWFGLKKSNQIKRFMLHASCTKRAKYISVRYFIKGLQELDHNH